MSVLSFSCFIIYKIFIYLLKIEIMTYERYGVQ